MGDGKKRGEKDRANQCKRRMLAVAYIGQHAHVLISLSLPHFSPCQCRSIHGISNPNDIISSNDRIRLPLIGWWNRYRMRR